MVPLWLLIIILNSNYWGCKRSAYVRRKSRKDEFIVQKLFHPYKLYQWQLDFLQSNTSSLFLIFELQYYPSFDRSVENLQQKMTSISIARLFIIVVSIISCFHKYSIAASIAADRETSDIRNQLHNIEKNSSVYCPGKY